MVQHALMPTGPVPARHHAAYGDLVEQTFAILAEASALSPARFTNAADARAELLGYLLFLRTAGKHIDLLGRLIGHDAEDMAAFGRLLTKDTPPEVSRGNWNNAARHLGGAHDLLLSHLDFGLTGRTPDAEALLTHAALLGAARKTVDMLISAGAARSRLTHQVSIVERGSSGDGQVSLGLFGAARRAERHIHVQGRAVMWDLHRLGVDDTSPALESLDLPIVVPAQPSDPFEFALTALRTLRQLSYDQARGRANASPASLRDLALLGEVATVPEPGWLPPAENGLARVQRANVLDGLADAHDRWALTGRHLTTTIQGLTQAPGTYAASVRSLQEAVRHQPSIRLAVIRALPALADEATRTVLRLAGTGSLVTRQRVPMHLHATWASIPFEDAQTLIESFDSAGSASRSVAERIRQLAPENAREAYPPDHFAHQGVERRHVRNLSR